MVYEGGEVVNEGDGGIRGEFLVPRRVFAADCVETGTDRQEIFGGSKRGDVARKGFFSDVGEF